ncbi:MAG TPA: MXAN_5187 C-terminal domain-containing protein [Myxococcales bacterium]|nr:MXAN_5187 C-terminal domain-containing protein [Myxococcales bacterium]
MAAPNGTQQLPQEKFAEELTELDEGIQNLQVLYEKYFLGIDRRPPDEERKRISKKAREMRDSLVKNTALKFKIGTLFAKLLSFERMWDRTLREIEDGTYKRDVFKAKLRMREREGAPAARPRAAAAEGPPQIPEEKLRRLYDTFLVARRRCGEATDGISYDSVASRIRAQVPQLLEKHKARNIEFKVVIKGGKAVLKAVPHS